MAFFEVGDVLVFSSSWAVAGVPTDPGSLSLTVTAPDGTVSTPTPIRDSAGVYHADVASTQSGQWIGKYIATGTAAGESATTYYVYPGGVVKPLVLTPGELENYLKRVFDDDQTIFSKQIIEALQDELEMRLGRPLTVRAFVDTPTIDVRQTDQYGTYSIVAARTPVVSVQSLTIDGNLVDPSAYQVHTWGVVVSQFTTGFGLDSWAFGESPAVLSYIAGKDGRNVPGLKTVMLRAAAREFLGRDNDVQGLKRYSVERGSQFDYGDDGQSGFTDAEIASLSRLKRRVLAI